MKDNKYLVEIERSFKTYEMISGGGYSNYGDRSLELLKIIRSLKSSEEIKLFMIAYKHFIASKGDGAVDFLLCALIDAVE